MTRSDPKAAKRIPRATQQRTKNDSKQPKGGQDRPKSAEHSPRGTKINSKSRICAAHQTTCFPLASLRCSRSKHDQVRPNSGQEQCKNGQERPKSGPKMTKSGQQAAERRRRAAKSTTRRPKITPSQAKNPLRGLNIARRAVPDRPNHSKQPQTRPPINPTTQITDSKQ